MTQLLDTNIILRVLLDDSPDSPKAIEMLGRQSQTLILRTYVVAEVVYILLTRSYDRKQIYEALRELINARVNIVADDYLDSALRIFSETKLDFVDCALIAEAIYSGFEVASLDKKLMNTLARLN
jgi:predicted nucleic-acid-binding protein